MIINRNFTPIIISGNSFIDKCLLVKNFSIDSNHSIIEKKFYIGGVFNFLKINYSHKVRILTSLSKRYSYLKPKRKYNVVVDIDWFPSTCEAIIIIDNFKSTRTSLVKHGDSMFYKPKYLPKSTIHHISYLDLLPNYDVNFLKKLKRTTQFLSADLCKNDLNYKDKVLILKKLKILDLLICSTAEVKALFSNNLKKSIEILKKYIDYFIIHSPKNIYIFECNKIYSIKIKSLTNVNVLGAGDIFAGLFLNNFYSTNLSSIYNSALVASDLTRKVLLNEKEK